jgi:hypothetical protein
MQRQQARSADRDLIAGGRPLAISEEQRLEGAVGWHRLAIELSRVLGRPVSASFALYLALRPERPLPVTIAGGRVTISPLDLAAWARAERAGS